MSNIYVNPTIKEGIFHCEQLTIPLSEIRTVETKYTAFGILLFLAYIGLFVLSIGVGQPVYAIAIPISAIFVHNVGFLNPTKRTIFITPSRSYEIATYARRANEIRDFVSSALKDACAANSH